MEAREFRRSIYGVCQRGDIVFVAHATDHPCALPSDVEEEGRVSSMATKAESGPRKSAVLDDPVREAEREAKAPPQGEVVVARTDEQRSRENQVPDIAAAACCFAAARQRPAAVYLLGEGSAVDGIADTPITTRSASRLAAALGDARGFEQLDLVVHFSGGDIHAAYQMMTLLRGRMT